MAGTSVIREKIADILEEMKHSGLYKREFPTWVNEYEKVNIVTEHDFSEWLQFVYLPNLLQQAGQSTRISQKKNIVPQVLEYYGDNVQKGKLLQLLIELDSLV